MSKIVVIGAGHGLPDPGACGIVQEYKVVLQLAQLVEEVLKRHGVKTVMLRTGERSLSGAADLKQNKREDLERRVAISNQSSADFHLELHMNAGGGTGYETLCYSENEQIRTLHNSVMQYLRPFNIRDRGIKIRTDVRVLQVKVKVALLECLFVDHPSDAAYMKDSAFLSGLSEAIGRGVLAAIGVAYVPAKQPTTTTQKEEPKMKQADAEKVIAYLQAAWKEAKNADEQKEIGRLADEVRVVAGMRKVNG
ncbi:N-acetylmuramoyl-L-alanine amidase [Aneurinibacillus soli]|uniref:Sporulation-specific N-acetylmuramoyl-L-alanine amidase n=1 Tax=Aneurinibacillus soli TaxID=1500254 RepID=A0A0U5BA96_9BACL|nr:N-acetylmuramoyl-L-alanine amidase [Aneurinibacillus soli]PYE63423.1 N-acetylmuramoyl-L-alanine amidase [Aneurinibacillus soli]BAU27645.1 Sporulation-specific N-acetylmuramoyl-L-alanine amidase [Aneurinibacillus soli]